MATQDRLPTGNGDYSGAWSSNSGAHYSCVDDPVGAPDDATSYIYTQSTTDVYRLFTFPAFTIPEGSTIVKLTITIRHRSQSAGQQAQDRAGLKVNGSYYLVVHSATVFAGSAWQTDTYDYTLNPDTGSAWTLADINGTGSNPFQQAGMYGSRIGTGSLQGTQVIASCEYTPPTLSGVIGGGMVITRRNIISA